MSAPAVTRCLVLNDREPIPTDMLDRLADRLTVSWCQGGCARDVPSVFAQHPDTQILVTTYMDLGAGHLRLLPSLGLIVTTTTAVEYVDLAYCADRGVIVCNTAGYTQNAVAEHAIALLLAVAKRIVPVNDRVRSGDLLLDGEWSVELAGKQLGIVGMGQIGTALARIAQGLGMRVAYFNRSPRDLPGCSAVDLPTLMSESDAIAIAVSLNEGSRGMIDALHLRLMKPTAILVSTSPETVMDLDALVHALRSGRIAGAGLDLVGDVPRDWDVPNLILSSRFANRTHECFERRQATWRRTLAAYIRGEPPPGRIV